MNTEHLKFRYLLGAVALMVEPALAQFEPTRMQRCNAEVTSTAPAERKRLLGDCLRIRLEGERLVERSCRRKFRELTVEATASKEEWQKQCVTAGLAASYAELPRRPPPAPKAEDPTLAGTPDATAAKPMQVSTQKP